MTCPKCGRARAEAQDACPRCGLVFALWKAEHGAGAPTLDGDGQRLWAAVQAAWTDDRAHDAFVKHCSQRGRLAVAGRLYRERLDQTPDDPVAARMQKRIVAMATAALAPTATPRAPVTRARWFTWVILGAAVVGAAGALLLRR